MATNISFFMFIYEPQFIADSVDKVHGNICNLILNSSNDIINGCGEGFGGIEYRNASSNIYARNVWAQSGDVTFNIIHNSSQYVEIITSQRQRYSTGTLSNLSSHATYIFSSDKPYFYTKYDTFFDKENVNATHYNTIFISKNNWMNQIWYNDHLNNVINFTDMTRTDSYTVGVDSNLSWIYARNNTYSDGFGIIRLNSTFPFENAYIQPVFSAGDEIKYDSSIINAESGMILGSNYNYTKEFIIYPTSNYTNVSSLAANLRKVSTISNLSIFHPHAMPDTTFYSNIGNIETSAVFIGRGYTGVDDDYILYPSRETYLYNYPQIIQNGVTTSLGRAPVNLTYYNNGTYSKIVKSYNPTLNFTVNVTYESFSDSPFVRVVINFTSIGNANLISDLYTKFENSAFVSTIDRIKFNNKSYNITQHSGIILPQSSLPPNPKYFYWYNASFPDLGVYVVTPNLNHEQYFVGSTGSTQLKVWAFYNPSKQNITSGQSFIAEYWILQSPYNITSILNTSTLHTNFLQYYNYTVYFV